LKSGAALTPEFFIVTNMTDQTAWEKIGEGSREHKRKLSEEKEGAGMRRHDAALA